MQPRQRDLTTTSLGFLIIVCGLLVLVESRRHAELAEERQIERNRRLELQEALKTREQQLNGALEKITEIQGGQPAGNGDE